MNNVPKDFLLLYRKFRSNEHVFKNTETKNQFIISDSTGIVSLAYFEAHPSSSLNDLKQESVFFLETIHNILKKHAFVPYRYRATDEIKKDASRHAF